MKVLTEPQLLEFTNDLDRISVAIGTLRQNAQLGNGQVLTPQQQDDLLLCQIKLFRTSAQFYSQAIVLNAETIHNQLNQLNIACASIDKTLAKINTVNQVLEFSTLALNVATAVSSGNILDVTESLNGLLGGISKIDS